MWLIFQLLIILTHSVIKVTIQSRSIYPDEYKLNSVNDQSELMKQHIIFPDKITDGGL